MKYKAVVGLTTIAESTSLKGEIITPKIWR